jgi:hypothetical protein
MAVKGAPTGTRVSGAVRAGRRTGTRVGGQSGTRRAELPHQGGHPAAPHASLISGARKAEKKGGEND